MKHFETLKLLLILLTYIINKDHKINKYSEDAKTALARSIYKKDDRDQIKKSIKLLNGFSKIYERSLTRQLIKIF